ncbi:MAG: hypothetical protein H6760_04410 [Candidatus Nomurabacteria bacterium]|nr:MAG: hypothetical protein H6760_04410 [Candidatus Nomurabacteria bacterium]
MSKGDVTKVVLVPDDSRILVSEGCIGVLQGKVSYQILRAGQEATPDDDHILIVLEDGDACVAVRRKRSQRTGAKGLWQRMVWIRIRNVGGAPQTCLDRASPWSLVDDIH